MALLASILEPFMPGFSAKIYKQMNIERSELDDTRWAWLLNHPERIKQIVPSGHKIGEPKPIFKERTPEEMETWKAQFGGTKTAPK